MLRNPGFLVVAVLSTMLLEGAASGGIMPSLVLIPIDSGAATDDPTLANYQAIDLQVTLTGGEKFVAGQMRVQLYNGGTFYIPPVLDGDTGINPVADVGTPFRFLKDDTFVTTPNFQGSRVTILGASYVSPDPTGPAIFPRAINDKSVVDVYWWDSNIATSNYTDGTYTVARLVMQRNAYVYMSGAVIGSANWHTFWGLAPLDPPGGPPAPPLPGPPPPPPPQLPEPAGGAFLLAGLAAVARRLRP